MSAKRRISLRAQVKREVRLWCLFALDGLSDFERSAIPSPLSKSLERFGSTREQRAHLKDQLNTWKADFGVARLLFSHVKNRSKLEKVWADESLWSEVSKEVTQYLTHRTAIDQLVSLSSLRWKIQRMGSVDRAILRLGAFELCFYEALPARAVLNQAIELGKRYGSSESSRFINGVLDRVAQELQRIKRRDQPSPSIDVTRR